MKKISSVKLNAFLNVLLTASNSIVALLTIPYISRVLTVEGNGAVSFAQSVSGWLGVFCTIGIPVYGMRECAKNRDSKEELSKIVYELLLIITFFTTLTSLVFLSLIFFLPSFRTDATLMIFFLIGMIFNSYGIEWFYRGIENYIFITSRAIFFKITTLILIFVFVNNENDYLVYGFILSVVVVLNNIINISQLRKYITFRGISNLEIRSHFRSIRMFAISEICITAYTNLDMVLLGLLSGNYEVGIYQLAVKCKTMLNAVAWALCSSVSSRVSYEYQRKNLARCKELWNKSFLFILLFVLSIFFYTLVYGDYVVIFLSSEKYMNSVLPLQISCIALIFLSLNHFLSYAVLVPVGKENVLMKSNIVGAILCLLFNLFFDSVWGAIGAACSITLGEMFVFAVNFKAANRTVAGAIKKKEVLKISVSIILSCMLLIPIHKYVVLSIFPTLLLSACLYFTLIFSLLIVLKSSITIGILSRLLRKDIHE